MRLLALALSLAAPAATGTIDVQWDGDSTCPSDQFRRSLATHLADVAAGPPIRVSVTVRRDADAWSLELALATPDGPSARTLAGPSCASVSAAAAFITALVVDPNLRIPEPTPPPNSDPADPPTTTSSAAHDPPAPNATNSDADPNPSDSADPHALSSLAPDPLVPPDNTTRPDPARKRRLRVLLRLAGGLEAFGMPSVGPQLNPAVGLLGPRWRVELTALYRAPTTASSPDVPTAGGSFRLWTLGLRACGVLRPRPLEVPLCLGVEAGQARGDGHGFAAPQRARLPWIALTAGPALAWAPRPWLALWAGIDLAVPLLAGRFAIENLGEVHSFAPVSLRAALGLETRF